jgi:hypothetical protein
MAVTEVPIDSCIGVLLDDLHASEPLEAAGALALPLGDPLRPQRRGRNRDHGKFGADGGPGKVEGREGFPDEPADLLEGPGGSGNDPEKPRRRQAISSDSANGRTAGRITVRKYSKVG